MTWNWLTRLVSKRVRELEGFAYCNEALQKANMYIFDLSTEIIKLHYKLIDEEKLHKQDKPNKGDLIWREDVMHVIKNWRMALGDTWYLEICGDINSIPAVESHELFEREPDRDIGGSNGSNI